MNSSNFTWRMSNELYGTAPVWPFLPCGGINYRPRWRISIVHTSGRSVWGVYVNGNQPFIFFFMQIVRIFIIAYLILAMLAAVDSDCRLLEDMNNPPCIV